MDKPGGGAGLYLTTAVIVGLPLGIGLALIAVWVWTVATSVDEFGRQIAQVLGVAGAVACAPAVIWALAFGPWMRRRIAEGQRAVVVRGLITLALTAVVGLGLLVGIEVIA